MCDTLDIGHGFDFVDVTTSVDNGRARDQVQDRHRQDIVVVVGGGGDGCGGVGGGGIFSSRYLYR